jgi:hypothetical protein
MADPVEVIARGLCKARILHNARLEQRNLTQAEVDRFGEAAWRNWTDDARAALAALEGEGFRVFSIVPVKREPEPLVFEDD